MRECLYLTGRIKEQTWPLPVFLPPNGNLFLILNILVYNDFLLLFNARIFLELGLNIINFFLLIKHFGEKKDISNGIPML